MPSSAGSNESAYTAIESLPHLLDSPSTARASHDASVGPTGYLHDDEMATFGIWAEGSPGFAAPFQVTSAERLREPRRRKPPQLRSRTVRRSLDATFADAAATQPSCSAPRSPSSQHLADGDTCQGLATLREEAALHDDEAANSAASASGRCSPGNEGTSLGTSSQTSPSNASDATGAGRHCSRGVAASEPSDEAMASQASAETVHAANGPECNLAQALGGCRFLPLQESDARLVVGAMADGLAHMHDAGILHRDVGLGSVVLAASGALDTCRLLEGSHAAVMSLDCRFVDAGRVTQQAFAAPEICRSRTGSIVYTSAGDLWSLGVVLYTLLTGGQLPFGSCGPGRGFPGAPQAAASMDELQQWLDKHLQRLLAGNWTHQQWATAQGGQVAQQCVQPGPLSRPAQDLIRGLLRADPAQRPPALKVLGHPWTLALPEPIEPLQWGPDEQIPASYGPEEAHLTSTLSALQQLWVQPEHVVPGPSAREAHGAGASHADPGLTSLPGEKSGKKASSSMLGWFQKLLSRSGKRPGSGKGVGSDRDEEEPQDMMGVHHAHNW
ncbi:hypothetical protein WJX72_011377 [[Myrmecia] bisecta]|uniref:Protein kinase domain-containing protein n=1 Tax=[Myrmecia] bisecta TaxID=41462 RepID=A0AAW1QGI1_9CHLO